MPIIQYMQNIPVSHLHITNTPGIPPGKSSLLKHKQMIYEDNKWKESH